MGYVTIIGCYPSAVRFICNAFALYAFPLWIQVHKNVRVSLRAVESVTQHFVVSESTPVTARKKIVAEVVGIRTLIGAGLPCA